MISRRRLSGIATLSLATLFTLSLLSSCKKSGDEETPQQPQPAAAAALPPKPVPPFDAERALRVVDTQVNFGPRAPNFPGHAQEVEWLTQALKECTPNVQVQNFTHQGYEQGEELPLSNIIASFNPEATWRILIVTHFDSRPHADEDPRDTSKHFAVPAANDGASGTAVMLEMARAMKDNPPPIGVDLLFDDGEDYGDYDKNQLDWYFLGVKHFMQVKPANYNPRFAILLDMVGDKNAKFAPELNSVNSAPQFVSFIWQTAQSMGLKHFVQSKGGQVSDDHLPLIAGGIPSVDIIDADLVGHLDPDKERQYWHTLDDLPKHLSSETLDEVGRLMLTLIYDRFPRSIPSL
jgi:Zn-dependent M28 family amino/carboxypeptidase